MFSFEHISGYMFLNEVILKSIAADKTFEENERK